MDFLYQESFTPWETPNLDDRCINYLRKPQQIFLKTPHRHTQTLHEPGTQSRQKPLSKKQQLTSNEVFVSKQNKNYFIERNKVNSRSRPARNMSKVQLKQSHQSLHFSRQAQNLSVKVTRQQLSVKQHSHHTLTNFSVKRKSLKEKIQKTKKLLEKNENVKTSEFRDKIKQEKIFEQSLQRLLSLSKSHHNLTASLSLNPSIIDSFFQTKNILRNHQRGKKSCADLLNSKTQKRDPQNDNNVNFLQSKSNITYLKKKGYNMTFYKQGKQQKMMNLPKIQILDWQKPQI